MVCDRCGAKRRYRPNRLITNYEGFAVCHACYKLIGREIYKWLSSGPKAEGFVYQRKAKKGK